MLRQLTVALGVMAGLNMVQPGTISADDAPAAGGAAPAPRAMPVEQASPAATAGLLFPGEERHLRHLRRLTFGHAPEFAATADHPANYAEAYWAPDMRRLILQATCDDLRCDQLFEFDLLTGSRRMINDGQGRVTCGFFTADGKQCIYSSTAENGGPECPPRPDYSMGYVWPLYPAYDIYLADVASGRVLRNLTQHPGYDAEATIDWHTGWMYFTSLREGDLDIYRMQMDSGELERLTDDFGYDGGPFISYDGRTVVYRRAIITDEAQREDYLNLLANDLIRPGELELMAMDSDGGNKRQLTHNGCSNFAPFLHPDGKTVIFCSNLQQPGGRYFDLYTMPLSGGEPERITFCEDFDGFPMFSPDGRYLVFCSNRDPGQAGETNVFIAEWIP